MEIISDYKLKLALDLDSLDLSYISLPREVQNDRIRQNRLGINDPQSSHVFRTLPGRVFSALQLICIMYAGFKRIEPGMDIGVELGEEWGMAERLTRNDIP